jgi:hypothetical protein
MSAHRHLRLVPAGEVGPDPSEPGPWAAPADLERHVTAEGTAPHPSFRAFLPDFAGAWLVLQGGRP